MKDKVKIISRKTEFEGYHKLESFVIQPKSLKTDDWGVQIPREIFHIGEVSIVLPYHPETDEILLNQEFRVGAFLANDPNPWLYELSAGGIDKGETPEEAAIREAKEETGCDIIDIEKIGVVYPTPSCVNEKYNLFCARLKDPKAGFHGLEKEHEEIQTHLFPATEVIRMLDAGEITNGGAVIALHWFARNHDRLRKKWGKSK